MPGPNDGIIPVFDVLQAPAPTLPNFDVAQAFAAGIKAVEAGRPHFGFGLDQKVIQVKQQLDEGRRVTLSTRGVPVATFEPEPGAVLAACLRDTAADTFSCIETALKPYTNIGLWGVSASHQWRAGEHYRPFHAIGAIAAAIDARPITDAQVRAAAAVVPGVSTEFVRLALEAARAVQKNGQ